MPGKRPRDAEPAGQASDQDINWAAKAKTTFKLLTTKKAATAEEQAAWQHYIAVRKAEKKCNEEPDDADADSEAADEESEDEDEQDSYENCKPRLMANVMKVLESNKQLTKKEFQLLASCVVINGAGADYADGDDVREYDAIARIYSVDGNSAVDMYHRYHDRVRGEAHKNVEMAIYGFEHYAEVSAAIRQPADEPSRQPEIGKRGDAGFSRLWEVTLRNTRTREQVYAENRCFRLTASQIKSFRKALFTGPQGKALGDKLSDYDLMLLLLTPVGMDEAGLGLPCDMRIKHSCDGWEGVHLRRVCSAATKEDADWKEYDFEAAIAERRRFDRQRAYEHREMFGSDRDTDECEGDGCDSDGYSL